MKQGCPALEASPGSQTLYLCAVCLPKAAEFNIEGLISRDGHGLLFYSFNEWSQIKTFTGTGLPHCASIFPSGGTRSGFWVPGDGLDLHWTLISLAYWWACDGVWSLGCVEPWSQILEWVLGGPVAEGTVQVSIGGAYMLNSFNIWSLDLCMFWI